jgi:glycosyltransferase involved in cell wall biosynthesis
MKIAYDNIIFSLQKAGGISIYWTELIKRFKNKSEILFYEKKNNNIFRKLIFYDVKNESALGFKILRYLPFIKKLPEKSIFHSSYYRIPLQKDVVKIITVYDFTYEYYCTGASRWIHSWQKNFAIKNSDGVICISDSTKNDLFKFLPNIDKEKVKTIYISAGKEFHKVFEMENKIKYSRFKEIENKKVILYVGDRKSKYKNFKTAVDVVSKLHDYILLSVGAGEVTVEEQLMVNQNITGRFFHYLDVSSEELNVLYNYAFCFLYPSSYEGFGIPVLESMRAGCPVISTNISSIPEVAGHAALLVDDICVENFIKQVKLLEDSEFRQSKINEGFKQAKKFSWDLCFEETIAFYNEIFKSKFNT